MATSVNFVQQALNSGKYAGAVWLEGSPSIENTSYWLSLMVDTTLPITANSAHHGRGEISPDDAHPGGYLATGGYGGIFGSMTAGAYLTNIPTRKHTWKSEVRLSQLPETINGQIKRNGKFETISVTIKTRRAFAQRNSQSVVTKRRHMV